MRRLDCNSLPVTQLLLQRRGNLKLNSITTMYYVSPCCFVFLLLPWTFLEYPKLAAAAGSITFDPLVNDIRVLAGHYQSFQFTIGIDSNQSLHFSACWFHVKHRP